MLKKVSQGKSGKAKGMRFAIVASRYNEKYVGGMLKAAREALKAAEEVTVVRVPGAFEIPVVAAELAKRRRGYDAVICLGVILQGETSHAEHIGTAVSQALAQIQVRSGTPVIHEVLVFSHEKQAKARCLGKGSNRGREAALTAVEMGVVMRGIRVNRRGERTSKTGRL